VTVGVVGLIALGLPTGAGAAPVLPQIAPEDLVQSVISATPPPFSGTVEVDNALGLPPIPGEGQLSGMLSNGTSHFQVWDDGHGRERLSVPSSTGEMTVVNDGMTVWEWDSVKRTVTESPKTTTGTERNTEPRVPADPAATARQIVGTLRQSSTVAVDGTGTVAGRPAYELVLTPNPTERTLLRQVRIAVDAQRRVPLAVEVDTNGSSDPALKVGFSQLQMTAPDPSLFQFTPPPGAKVQQREPDAQHPRQPQSDRRTVGAGWDTVLLTNVPSQMSAQQAPGGKSTDPRALVGRIGTPVSGTWGQGWVINTKAVTVLVTSDGRLALGAVPEQVLAEALGKS
jgi:outer membrane lipoprotein-sorting protein